MLRSLVGSEMCIRDRSMGSPLSPILANIFMELLEIYHILPNPLLNNSFWYRYVDDIFVAIPVNTNPIDILTFINNIHPNITFTIEHATNNTLPFLDTLLIWSHTIIYNTLFIDCLLYTSD